MCMYVYVRVCMCVHVGTRVCTTEKVCACTRVYVCECISVRTCLYVLAYKCVLCGNTMSAIRERRVPSPNRYMAFARFCFCKNNKRTIDRSGLDGSRPACSCQARLCRSGCAASGHLPAASRDAAVRRCCLHSLQLLPTRLWAYIPLPPQSRQWRLMRLCSHSQMLAPSQSLH